MLSFSHCQVFISFPHQAYPSSIQELRIIFITQLKKIQEVMLPHQFLIQVLTFHEEQHTKFHNLQTTKTQENNKDIKKQNKVPLKFISPTIPLAFSTSTSINVVNHPLGQSHPTSFG